MPRQPRHSCVELFAGGGGAAVGLSQAGYGHLLAVDWQPHCVETLQTAGFDAEQLDLNPAHHEPNEPGPAAQLVRGLQERGGESPTLLWASPPCQAWSQAGKRKGAADDRNGWPWTLQILESLAGASLAPEWVICENVGGMTNHRAKHCISSSQLVLVDSHTPSTPAELKCPGCYWERFVIAGLRRLYPHVEVYALDASDFGLPQTRQRVYAVAGPVPLSWNTSPQMVDRKNTLGDAIGLTATDTDGALDPRWANRPSPAVLATEYKGARHMFNLDLARTPMRASDALFRATGTVDQEAHKWTGRRRLTIEECAILQGFPADYEFCGNKQQRYEQVGNAVPPLMAQLLGSAVLERMKRTPRIDDAGKIRDTQTA